jgi:tetratricopeptide (TPR) repeat protein
LLIKKFSIDLKNWEPPKPELLKLGVAYRYPHPYVDRGRLLHALGCYRSAALEAKAALEIMPNCAEALKFMADYYFFDQKDYTAAYGFIRNSLIYAANDIGMRARLAMAYHMLKDDKKALKVADALIKNYPGAAEPYYTKAWITQDTDPRSAKRLLEQAVKLSSDKEPRYLDLLGDLWNREGDTLKAQKEWSRAFEYDSANEALKKKLHKG